MSKFEEVRRLSGRVEILQLFNKKGVLSVADIVRFPFSKIFHLVLHLTNPALRDKIVKHEPFPPNGTYEINQN